MILLVGPFVILLFLSVVLEKAVRIRHFHILWFLPRYENETYHDGIYLQNRLYNEILAHWSVNLGSCRRPDYHPLCTFHQKYRNGKLFSNYDTHFVQPSLTSDGISSVAFYVCKYMMKQNDRERRLQRALHLNLSESDYEEAWSIVKSRSLRSEHFGLNQSDRSSSYHVVSYLRHCIELSKGQPFPCFFSPDSNATFPLAPYYKRKGYIFTLSDWMDFHMNDDSVILDYNKTLTEGFNGERELERMQRIVESKDLSVEFDDLF